MRISGSERNVLGLRNEFFYWLSFGIGNAEDLRSGIHAGGRDRREKKTPDPAGGAGVLASDGLRWLSEVPFVLIQIADACGEEQDAGGKIVFVAGLDGLVNVAGGD